MNTVMKRGLFSSPSKMSRFGRKAQKPQGAGGAAALVGVITFLIILYIVFLPASERDKILDTSTSGSSGSSPTSDSASSGTGLKKFNTTVLLVNPGRMDFQSNDKIEHLLPAVNLMTKIQATVLEEFDSVYVKSGVFSKEPHKVGFTINDLDNVDNVLLGFKVKDGSGRLIVNLNNVEVFNSDITETTEPIKLKKSDLKNVNNIEFSVSSPGIAFWKVNEYLLDNVAVTAEVKNTAGQKAKSVFIVDNFEEESASKLKLSFVPECDAKKAGVLTVFINGNQVFSGIPDCGTPFIQEYSSAYLLTGENNLEFSGEGKYLIDRISLETKLKKPRDFSYDFQINESIFREIQLSKTKSNLTFTFIDDNEDKEAQLILNGHKLVVSTSSSSYSRLVDPFLKQGFNYLKIIPKKKMFVPEIRLNIKKD